MLEDLSADLASMSGRQRGLLDYIHRYQTPEHGVIISIPASDKFLRLGICVLAERRPYARLVGRSVRLTDYGLKLLDFIDSDAT